MRNFAIAAIVVIVLLLGGYTVIWHKEADDFKASTEQFIVGLNQKGKAMGMPADVIRYASLETSGFPFSMNFTFTHPVVNLPLSSILRLLPSAKMHAADPSAPANWNMEYSSEKPVEISGSIRGNSYLLRLPDDIRIKSTVNNVLVHTIQGSGGSTTCRLDVEQPIGGMPWTMRPIFSDAKTFFEVFRGLDCDTAGLASSDAQTHAKLASMDGSRVKITNSGASAADHGFSFAMDFRNFQATPIMDQWGYENTQLAYALMGIPAAQRMAPMRMSEYSPLNMTVDIAYKGPSDGAHFADPDMKMHLDVNKLDIQSAIFNLAFNLHVASDPHGNERNASLALHSKAAVSERYDAILAEQTVASITQAMQTEGKFGPQLMIANTLKQLGTPQELTAIILPKFHSFGNMAFDIDGNVKGPNHGADLFKRGNLKLEALDWISTPYGVTLKGDANFSEPDGKPFGDFTKTCINCDALITDLGAYIMRVDALGSRMQPPHAPTVTPALVEGVRQFIHGIAENKDAKDLVTEVKFSATGFTVSGKNLAELMSLYLSTIAPNMPQRQGVAGNGPGAPGASQLARPPALR